MNYAVISLNLQGYFNWEVREPRLLAYLNQTQADFVCLQEVRFDNDLSPYDEARYLNARLDTPYEYAAAAVTHHYEPSIGKPYREGLAVLSRYPLKNSEALALTKYSEDKHQRVVLAVEASVGEDRTVKLANVHFSNNTHSVQHLAETLAIFSQRGEERIVVGDFNIFDMRLNRDTFEPIYQLSTDHTPYVSFPSKKETLDYLLLPRAYRFGDITTADGLSDHVAMSFTIEEA